MFSVLFWVLIAVVLYTYVGYAVLITVLARRFALPVRTDAEPRRVTLLIAAYNEEAVIAAKLRNSLALEYPRGRLQIVVVTDGSTDRTVEIAAGFEIDGVDCYHTPDRRGKMAAINRVLPLTDGEIVVFSDANAFYSADALRCLVAPFADPQVGCVCGEKRVRTDAPDGGPTSGEGLYWRYESHLKAMDSRLYSVVGAAGEVYAVRRDVLQMAPDNSFIDDFMVSMLIAQRGYRVIYEPRAIAYEVEAPRVQDEFERRARIACGGFQSIWWLRRLLVPRPGHLRLWFAYVSHRVMRWAVAPFALFLAIAVNAVLVGTPLYLVLFSLQLLFYAVAIAGLVVDGRGRRVKALFIPGYFVLMNAAAVVGLWRYLTRAQRVTWRTIEHRVVQPE